MLKALFLKRATIPDSFNNCSTYFCKDIDIGKITQFKAKTSYNLREKIMSHYISEITSFE